MILGIFFTLDQPRSKPGSAKKITELSAKNAPVQTASESLEPPVDHLPDMSFVGPRQNILASTPADYGFWSFAVPVPGILSRSGQPTLKDFQWLKNNGWRGNIDLRIDGDHNEVSDDAEIPGFLKLGFHYLKIQMRDGAAPTDDQAKTFLNFATDPQNQPAHVHCRGGIGRAGVMVALYRYAVQGWPVEKAVEESKLFSGGIDSAQANWLENWAQTHPPMEYAGQN